MKKTFLLTIPVISAILIFAILAGGCISLLTPFIEAEIMQMLDELGEANVNGDVDQIIIHYTDPITEVNNLSEETYVTSLEDKRIELEDAFAYYFNCLIDDFYNEEITILDTSNAIVECDEHVKLQDLSDETIYESIDRVRLTLIKIDGDWKVSVYELMGTEEVIP